MIRELSFSPANIAVIWHKLRIYTPGGIAPAIRCSPHMVNVDNNYDRNKYQRAMKYKMARYYDLGIKFVSIYPDNMKNLDWVFRTKFKKVTGIDLPRK